MGISKINRSLFAAALAVIVPSAAHAAVLLNDTFADGNRTSTSLPSDSAVYIGQSAGNGSNSVTPGHLNFVLPTNSLKIWTYFTSDQSAPDGNQPHNGVTTLGVGDTLVASTQFSMTGLTATTGKSFRFGLFFDPTDARVQSDVNSDGGGGTAPWTDALGYGIQLPLTTAANSSPFQIVKRTTSNSSLLGSGSAFTNAPTGGSAYSMADGTIYTLTMALTEISASDMQVTVTLSDPNGVLATQTVHDTGTAFGGTAIGAGLLPGSQSIYTQFDQMFFRNSDATQATTLDFTNFRVDLTVAPEPASLAAFGLALLPLARRRSK
jgi:hypothetical protein